MSKIVVKVLKPHTGDQYAWRLHSRNGEVKFGWAREHTPDVVSELLGNDYIMYAEIEDIRQEDVVDVNSFKFVRRVYDQRW